MLILQHAVQYGVQYRWVSYHIGTTGKEVEIEKVGARESTWDEFISELPEDKCRYGGVILASFSHDERRFFQCDRKTSQSLVCERALQCLIMSTPTRMAQPLASYPSFHGAIILRTLMP